MTTDHQADVLSERICELFDEDADHRFVVDYAWCVENDCGTKVREAVEGEVVTTIQLLEELVGMAERAKSVDRALSL